MEIQGSGPALVQLAKCVLKNLDLADRHSDLGVKTVLIRQVLQAGRRSTGHFAWRILADVARPRKGRRQAYRLAVLLVVGDLEAS